MSQKKPIKKRNRDAGQIAKEVQSDLWAAHDIAVWGRKRTPLEKAVWKYLHHMDDGFAHTLTDWKMKMALLGGGPAFINWLTSNEPDEDVELQVASHRAAAAESLCELFLDAVNRRDGSTLRNLAKEVDEFTLHSPAMDPRRAGILTIKSILDECGKSMTIKELAALLQRKTIFDIPKLSSKDDGYSKLRALAKALKFPIAKDKVGAPKKPRP